MDDKWVGSWSAAVLVVRTTHIAREMKVGPKKGGKTEEPARQRHVVSPPRKKWKPKSGSELKRLGPYDLALKHPVFIRGSSSHFRVSLFCFYFSPLS